MKEYSKLKIKSYLSLNEAFKNKDFEKAIFNIIKILKKRVGSLEMHGIKPVYVKKMKSGRYFGYIYYVRGGPDRIRFNWKQGSDSSSISSLDLYDGTSIEPTRTIETYDLNIVQIIDIITAVYRKNAKREVIIKEDANEFFVDAGAAARFPYKGAIPFFQTKIGTAIPSLPRNDIVYEDLFDEYINWADSNSVKRYIRDFSNFQNEMKKWGVNLQKKVSITKAEKEVKLVTPKEDFMAKLFQDLGLKPLDEKEIFQQLERKINLVLDKKLPGAIIVGTPGIGKSYTVEAAIAVKNLVEYEDWNLIKGKESTAKLFQDLWKYRSGLIVLDDCDQPLLDPDGTNMLKTATDSGTRKISSGSSRNNNEKLLQAACAEEDHDYFDLVKRGEWDLIHSIAMSQETPLGPPNEFYYEGQVIAISNLFARNVDTALQDRGGFIEIKLNVEQIFLRIEDAFGAISKNTGYSMSDLTETLKWLREVAKIREDALRKLSFRKFDTAVSYYLDRKKYAGWQQMALKEIAKDPTSKQKGA